jgi:hypothetical protein
VEHRLGAVERLDEVVDQDIAQLTDVGAVLVGQEGPHLATQLAACSRDRDSNHLLYLYHAVL